MRQKTIIGNWKTYLNYSQAEEYFQKIKNSHISISTKEIILLPPFCYLDLAKRLLGNTVIKIGSQNIYWENGGEYTGEIIPKMVKEFGDYALVGHSKRREIFNETDKIVNQKIEIALLSKLNVIMCFGEMGKNSQKDVFETILNQVENCLENIGIEDAKKIVFVYEPAWAITNNNHSSPASGKLANEICARIRILLSNLYSKDYAQNARILYGGSINSQNYQEYNLSDIDGLLIGKASTDSNQFIEIIKNYK